MDRYRFLTIFALAVATGLFFWANFQPERLVILSAGPDGYEVIRQGPGWPIAAYKNYAKGPLNFALENHYEQSNKISRIRVWLFNGPVGALLLIALVANLEFVVIRLVRSPRS